MSNPAGHLPPIGKPSWKGLFRKDVIGALIRYRVMAFIVGTGLLILVCVAVPLQYGAGVNLAAEIVGTMHGYLYIVYLISGADLARRAHWKLVRILMVVAAGFLPFLAFIVEHRVYRQMQVEWVEGLWGADGEQASAPTATDGVSASAIEVGAGEKGNGKTPSPPR